MMTEHPTHYFRAFVGVARARAAVSTAIALITWPRRDMRLSEVPAHTIQGAEQSGGELDAWEATDRKDWHGPVPVANLIPRRGWAILYLLPADYNVPGFTQRARAKVGVWEYSRHQLAAMWRRIRLAITFNSPEHRVVCSEATSRIVWPMGDLLRWAKKRKHDFVAPVHVRLYAEALGLPERVYRDGKLVKDEWPA